MKRRLFSTLYLVSLATFLCGQSETPLHHIPVPDWAKNQSSSRLGTKGPLDFDIHLDENYPPGSIGEIIRTNPDGIADLLNKKFEIKGNVHSTNLLGNKLSCFVMDKDSNGLFVENGLFASGFTPKLGEELAIRGFVNQTNGRISFEVDSLWRTGTKSVLLSPKVVKNLDESTESKLVKLEKVRLLDPDQWKQMSVAPYWVTVSNGSRYFEVLILPYSTLNQIQAPFGNFDLIGFGAQNDNSLPYTDNYYLIPRDANDVIPQKVYQPFTIPQLRSVDNFGIATNITQHVRVSGIVSSPNFAAQNKLEFLVTDPEGAGITIYNFSGNFSYSVQERDVITVLGTIKQVAGLTVIAIDTLFKSNQTDPYKAPQKVEVLEESIENTLATWHQNLRLVNPSEWTQNAPYFDVNLTDGTQFVKMRVRAQTNLAQLPNPQLKLFKLSGQITQNSHKLPYLDSYLFQPRYASDLEFVSTVVELTDQDKLAYPNPMNDILYLTDFHRKAQEVFLSDEQGKCMLTRSSNSVNIDTQFLPSGTYFLSSTHAGTTFVQKLVKY